MPPLVRPPPPPPLWVEVVLASHAPVSRVHPASAACSRSPGAIGGPRRPADADAARSSWRRRVKALMLKDIDEQGTLASNTEVATSSTAP